MSVYVLSKWKLICDEYQHFEKLKYGTSLFGPLFVKDKWNFTFIYLIKNKVV